MTGRELRLRRLQVNGVYLLVAADHGLSHGLIPGLEGRSAIARVARMTSDAGMQGLVLNYGMVRAMLQTHCDDLSSVPSIVVQVYGRAGKARFGGPRVPLCSIEDALSVGGDCVAFQIEADATLRDVDFGELAGLASGAHRHGLPVLLMASVNEADGCAEFLDVVRALSELPVDLLKLDPGARLESLPNGCLTDMPVPCVVAGGPTTDAFDERMRHAARVGFAGVCLGRNFFQSGQPLDLGRRLTAHFAGASVVSS